MHLFLTILFTFSSWASVTKQDIDEAKRTIEMITRPLVSKSTKKSSTAFKVDQCEKYKVNLEDLILMKKTINLTYKFKKGCDIEGTIIPKLLQSFPLKLALRHAGVFEQVTSSNKITADLNLKPILFLETTSGVLTGKKGLVNFELDYRIQIDPLVEGKAGRKNLGGELRIMKIYGEKVNIKEKILIN